ncbi:MAG: hypothetical protein ACR2PY_07060 [Salinispira sp.]
MKHDSGSPSSGRIQIHTYVNNGNSANTYLIWQKNSFQSLLIDPVCVDIDLFEIITGNNLEITAIYFTDAASASTHNAIRSIPNIYPNARMYGVDLPAFLHDYSHIINIRKQKDLTYGTYTIIPLFIEGQYGEALAYRIENFLFPGPIVSAGSISAKQKDGGIVQAIEDMLFTLPDNTLVFPLHGPPTTIAVEKEEKALIQIMY